MTSVLVPISILLAIGLTTILSISTKLFMLQAAVALAGFLGVYIFGRLDWRALLNYRWFIWGMYGVAAILLLAALFSAPVIRNTRSWLDFGVFSFQPVELAKVALILVYAQYFSRRHLMVARWQNILGSFMLFFIPAIVTMRLPDFGSTVVLFGIWFGFLLVSGLPRKRLMTAILVFLVVGIVGWSYVLKPYQRARIVALFFPEQHALTVSYSTIQSKIAIGSAGLWGKGYGQGSQTQLGFVSEPMNDFILAAVVESWGLVGGLLVISAFLALIFKVLQVGLTAARNFEKFVCLGAALVFSIHFLFNAGSALGIFPVVGVPFPFLSYGGSNLLANFSLIAIINAIAKDS